MRLIEGVEVVSSGNGGGGACHNDKPGQRNDKVVNGESRRERCEESYKGNQAGPATMTSRAK